MHMILPDKRYPITLSLSRERVAGVAGEKSADRAFEGVEEEVLLGLQRPKDAHLFPAMYR